MKVRYKNGFEGHASPAVAKILEAKGEAEIVKEKAEKTGLSKKERSELIGKAVKAGLGKGDELAKLEDEALLALIKDKA